MEEKSKNPELIFIELCNLLDVEVRFEADPRDGQKVSPVIAVTAMLSKIMAIMVYVGWSVPAHCVPPYNRVHADVEYWKKKFETKQKEEEKPSEEQKIEPPAG